MTKEEKNKDLEFLKEMKSNIDEMVDGFNLVNIEHVQTMVNDWIDELEETTPNNGWIKIESENDLPKEELDVHFIFTEFKGEKGRFQTFGVWDNKLKSFYSGALKIKAVTHYQPIEKPKPPIY